MLLLYLNSTGLAYLQEWKQGTQNYDDYFHVQQINQATRVWKSIHTARNC